MSSGTTASAATRPAVAVDRFAQGGPAEVLVLPSRRAIGDGDDANRNRVMVICQATGVLGLAIEGHVADAHRFIHGLAHVVDRQRRDADSRQRLHLRAGAADRAHLARDADAAAFCLEIDVDVLEQQRVAERDQLGWCASPPGCRRSAPRRGRCPWRCGPPAINSRVAGLEEDAPAGGRDAQCSGLSETSTIRAVPSSANVGEPVSMVGASVSHPPMATILRSGW